MIDGAGEKVLTVQVRGYTCSRREEDGEGESGLMVQEREDGWCRRERMDGAGEKG